MRYLTIEQVIELHLLIVGQSGGSVGLRDLNALESAVAQPLMSFEGAEPAFHRSRAALLPGIGSVK
jgi:death-on-curing protein